MSKDNFTEPIETRIEYVKSSILRLTSAQSAGRCLSAVMSETADLRNKQSALQLEILQTMLLNLAKSEASLQQFLSYESNVELEKTSIGNSPSREKKRDRKELKPFTREQLVKTEIDLKQVDLPVDINRDSQLILSTDKSIGTKVNVDDSTLTDINRDSKLILSSEKSFDTKMNVDDATLEGISAQNLSAVSFSVPTCYNESGDRSNYENRKKESKQRKVLKRIVRVFVIEGYETERKDCRNEAFSLKINHDLCSIDFVWRQRHKMNRDYLKSNEYQRSLLRRENFIFDEIFDNSSDPRISKSKEQENLFHEVICDRCRNAQISGNGLIITVLGSKLKSVSNDNSIELPVQVVLGDKGGSGLVSTALDEIFNFLQPYKASFHSQMPGMPQPNMTAAHIAKLALEKSSSSVNLSLLIADGDKLIDLLGSTAPSASGTCLVLFERYSISYSF